MALDLRHVRVFLAIVETGSLGRTAEALHLTEPAISRIIKRMEEHLHVQLFERRTTGMELTAFGHALLPYANLLSAEAARAVEEIDALRGLDRGTLRIGSVASAAIMTLPPALNRMLARRPGVQVQIMEAVEDKLAQALTNNTVDIVLAGEMAEDRDVLRVGEHRFSDRYLAIARAGHPLHDRGPLAFDDLEHAQWIMPPPDAEPRKQFVALMTKLGVAPPRIAVETRSPAMIKAMVAGSEFLGWLPEPLFAAEQAAGLIKPLPLRELTVPRRFYVYRRRTSFVSPSVKMFLAALTETDAADAPAWPRPLRGLDESVRTPA